ncbi:MAG TPA: hypothetical protein VGD60_18530, partial [Candidatus Acidoferrales bacterium]
MRFKSFVYGRVRRVAFVAALALLSFGQPFTVRADEANQSQKVALHDGWSLESGCKVSAAGEEISKPGFKTERWHQTNVPSTVVAALVADKTYPDPYYAKNLRDIPGTTYPIGKNFSLLPMAKDSPFRCSWWYRKEFTLAPNFDGRHVWLYFGGINNHANIWLNGKQIATAKDVAGAYQTYEFDISPYVIRGQQNALAVEAIAQTDKDLGINWVDWNPAPPDKEMGLWREVYLQDSGAVAIRYPQVITHFPSSALDQANLTVEAELHNAADAQITGVLDGRIGEIKFRQTYILKPHEVRTVRFTPEEFPQLQVKNPKIWWPYRMGDQNLETLSLRFGVGNDQSDQQTLTFGIREITS